MVVIHKYDRCKIIVVRDQLSVHAGDHVIISPIVAPETHLEGDVFKVIPGGAPSNPTVILETGEKGRVISVMHNIELHIMKETQYTENKERFGESVMKDKSIPQAVQSFLNSEGGTVYLGIKDSGTIEERLVGLDRDLEQMREKTEDTTDKLCDYLAMAIMDALEKHLASSAPLGPLVSVNFKDVRDKKIAEILISPSSEPWFYRHTSSRNKLKIFNIKYGDENYKSQKLDYFYIRRGASKKLLETHEEFYNYAKRRFTR